MKRIPWKIIWQRMLHLPFLAAEHAFLFTLLLIGVAGIFSLLIFAYGFSLQTQQVDQGMSVYNVREDLLLDTIGELEQRNLQLENAGKGVSRDIFNPD